MSMTIEQFAHRNVGQMALLEAKIAEFRAYIQIGNDGEMARNDAHSVLDSLLDGLADFTEAVKRGDFLSKESGSGGGAAKDMPDA